MARIILDLSRMSGIVQSMERDITRGQEDAMKRSTNRVERSLVRASVKATGGDRRLSRVGRATGEGTRVGSYLGYTTKKQTKLDVLFQPVGAWQIVDNSVSGGPTKPHTIGIDLRGNPRPIREPLQRWNPSLKMRAGGYSNKPIEHEGSSRFPHWANAWQSVQPTISRLQGEAFRRAIQTANLGG